MKNQLKINLRQGLIAICLLVITSCNGQNKSGSTASTEPKVDIHTAIITGDLNVLKQHIEFGKNLNEKEPMNGSTPLMTAAVFDKTEMAKLLINADVDLGIQNNDGSTALHAAAFFCRPEIVKFLIEKGADKTVKNNYGQTPYETVTGSFSNAKEVYIGIGSMLEPLGLKLDLGFIEKTRPQVATMLK